MPAEVSRVHSVLHVITCLDIGGAELTLQKLILSDPAAASRHVVISLRDIGPVGRELQAHGVVVHAVGMSPTRLNIRAFIRLIRLIREIRPAVIQTWMYHGDFFGGLAARFAGRREIVWGIRNTGFARESSRMTVWVMRACALLSSFVPRVIVCCAQSARVAHEKWGYDASRMRVIPNGFVLPDLSQRQHWRESMRAEVGLGQEDLVIGMIARFDPLKNHELFVRAAATVARLHPQVRFLLVGRRVDDTNDELMRWISQSDLPGRFVLTGERRDVDRCLAAMDVFCLTSTFEAFPNVVAEAMAMGVPCVVTDAGDASHIVGDTGWVVPTGDAERLSEALNRVVGMGPGLRNEAGGRARRRVEQQFSVDVARQLFEVAYADALVEKRRSDSVVEGH
jgi:glycosyltransferase involved in cell wall biosynthesis